MNEYKHFFWWLDGFLQGHLILAEKNLSEKNVKKIIEKMDGIKKFLSSAKYAG